MGRFTRGGPLKKHGMEKLDLAKHDKPYYTAKNKPELLNIAATQFLSVTGQGDPASPLFAEKLQSLYAVAYAVKFGCKAQGRDFTMPKLEGLWWFDEVRYGHVSMSETPQQVPRHAWHWRLLIRMPDNVTVREVQAAVGIVTEKKKAPYAAEVDLYHMEAHRCVQMLHTGPFDREPETLRQIALFMHLHKLSKNGLHHEIYLSDFRKTASEKLRTILREPC